MDWGAMFFQGWEGIVRTLLVGTLAYVVLVAFLRIAGKRSLAKLNAFERCQRFSSFNSESSSPDDALLHVRERAHDLAQPRPE